MSSVGVLDKVMAILRSFPNGAVRRQPTGIAAEVDMPIGTTYRLLKSMAAHGLLDFDEQGYRLGVTLMHLGALVSDSFDLKSIAGEHLAELRDLTMESVALIVRQGGARVAVAVLDSPSHLRIMGQVGVPLPLHVGASSRALLAWLDSEQRQEILAESIDRFGRAGFDADDWESQLQRTREDGWAESQGEREPGISSISVPVRDHTGAVTAAVSVTAPTSRLADPARRKQIIADSRATAKVISRRLGG